MKKAIHFIRCDRFISIADANKMEEILSEKTHGDIVVVLDPYLHYEGTAQTETQDEEE